MELTNINRGRKREKKREPISHSFGRVPPQSAELESAVLGAILLEKNAFGLASEILTEDAFYVESHKQIYSAMCSMHQSNKPVDQMTLVEELRKREELDLVGGPFYIVKLTNQVFSTANIELHSKIIMEKFILREIIRIGSEMASDGYEDSTDVFELLDKIETDVFKLTTNYVKKDFHHIGKGLTEVVNRIELLRELDEEVTGVHSGFDQLDKITHGWQNSDFIVIAARPSVGKTAFALNLALNASLHPTKPVPVGFFSLEMSSGQLITRMLSVESNIWLKKLSTGKLDDGEVKTLYKKGVDPLFKTPIYIDDTAALNIFELRAKARRMKSKHGVGLIIIDYLQLMSGNGGNKNGNREQEISKISRDLKVLSKELQLPIICLSQLSREVEKRSVKVPQLSDLRESGAIEQDSDMVIFLYRPSVEEAKQDGELANKGLVKIAKHRNGELGEIVFTVNNNVQQWKEFTNNVSIPSSFKSVDQANLEQINRYEPSDDEDEGLPF